jgi:hypothetical protein
LKIAENSEKSIASIARGALKVKLVGPEALRLRCEEIIRVLELAELPPFFSAFDITGVNRTPAPAF